MKMLVAGATGGIGAAVRTEAEGRGWTVIGTSRREDGAEYRIDFADRDGLELELMRLFTAEGPFDAVVYAAGVCPVLPLSRLDLATLAETQLVNCDAFLMLMKAFARPGAHAKPRAAAVAISSVSATEGWAGGVAYCASKGALSAACRALDAELKDISVSVLEPRYVLTDMFRKGAGRMGIGEDQAMKPEDLAKDVLDLAEKGISG